MLYHTQTLERVCDCTMYLDILRFVLTAKNVNNTSESLVHLSDALCLGVFSEWETEKRVWETLVFV